MLIKLGAKKNNRGFSLLEVIIAIAILALLSGYVLQSFVVSEKLNQKAAELDKAAAICVSYIEEFKAAPQAALEDVYQNSANGLWQAQSYYDGLWQECAPQSDWTYNVSSQVKRGGGDLYSITVSAVKKDQSGAKTTIASLENLKYLPEKAVQ